MAAGENTAITPTPDDEEAAAIIAALTAYRAEQRRPVPAPARAPSRWALAGRLASHGLILHPAPGVRVTWANVSRIVG
jgi:Acyl-CoA carboxylase epsilon subunit